MSRPAVLNLGSRDPNSYLCSFTYWATSPVPMSVPCSQTMQPKLAPNLLCSQEWPWIVSCFQHKVHFHSCFSKFFYHCLQLRHSPRQYLPGMPHTFPLGPFRIPLGPLNFFPTQQDLIPAFCDSLIHWDFSFEQCNSMPRLECLSYIFQESKDYLSIIFAPHYLKNTALQRGNSLNTRLIGIRVSCAVIFSNNPYGSYGFLAGWKLPSRKPQAVGEIYLLGIMKSDIVHICSHGFLRTGRRA